MAKSHFTRASAELQANEITVKKTLQLFNLPTFYTPILLLPRLLTAIQATVMANPPDLQPP